MRPHAHEIIAHTVLALAALPALEAGHFNLAARCSVHEVIPSTHASYVGGSFVGMMAPCAHLLLQDAP